MALVVMPVISVLLGAVFLGERLEANACVGMVPILVGSLVVNGIGWHPRGLAPGPASPAVH